MKLSQSLTLIAIVAQAVAGFSVGGKGIRVERDNDGLQDIVTYDEHSLMIYGQRLFVYSGEFHPFRLPVPDLWLDNFQKIKALGFNAVSFYVHWALVEGRPGHYTAEGIFALEPFFEATQQAGIYLIARPGPYINSEATGGGFPGWLQRVKGQLRTRAPDYLAATDNYVANVAASISKAQITNGGPIILVQPENEYSLSGIPGSEHSELVTGGFPDPEYFAYVKRQLRAAGIVVPLISNDAFAQGLFAPGSTINGTMEGNVDIYGHDEYPRGFSCSNPYSWAPAKFINVGGSFPTSGHTDHELQSPSTFYSVNEFQGGSSDNWGSTGYDQCADMVNMEFERVFYKNEYAAGVALLNLYMVAGGTNWGNLGQPAGYSSYDYGAPITETRELYREQVSEVKLQAQFLKVTPAYLLTSVGEGVNGTYSDSPNIFTTPLLGGNGVGTNFYIVRSTDVTRDTPITYRLRLQTSAGNLSIPQLGGHLTLNRRDSKWHVTDYNIGEITLLYSTAEIFTWKKFDDRTVLILYGGPGEQHEMAVVMNTTSFSAVIEGKGVTMQRINGTTILNWYTLPERRVVQVNNLFIYILDRNTAYNYWVPDFVRNDKWGAYSTPINETTSVIVQAGYLIRSVYVDKRALHIEGDLNATMPLKVISAPKGITELYFNQIKFAFATDPITNGWSATLQYIAPVFHLPDMSALEWKYLDDLPEVQPAFDDSLWTRANQTMSNNPYVLQTPTSLFASDYGYHSGILLYRGHFISSGFESTLQITTQGGLAFGTSVWLNNTYIGTWPGNSTIATDISTYSLPSNLSAGKSYVFTILIDNNGHEENFFIGSDTMKKPRGILNYTLIDKTGLSLPQSAMTWRLTGNLGGEEYVDTVRGPLNEGGCLLNDKGFTNPVHPKYSWTTHEKPTMGISAPGVAFYQASFDLNLPLSYHIPLSFNFGNTTNADGSPAKYRAQLWVNGYQFGKYINHIGPQTSFPVPQGILDYQGTNWLALEIWAHDDTGAHLTNFTLEQDGKGARTPIWTSMSKPRMAPMPSWSKREGAY